MKPDIQCPLEPPCGISRDSEDAEKLNKYSAFGMFLLLFGVSSNPTSVVYRCKKCHRFFEKETKV